MTQIKQSFAWWCYQRGGLTPEQIMRAAAEIGYAAVELLPDEYWQLARDHGLAIASVNGHASIEQGLNRREHHQRIERELRARIAQAEQWNVANLICFSGSRAGLDDSAGIEATAEGLRRVAKAAEDAGVTLILELLNSKVDHHDYHCDHTEWGVQVIEIVGSPRVKLLYDIYHMQIMEGDIIRTIRKHHDAFGHYHTAGNPGRNDLDDTQEINYPPIMRAILDTGYTGYVGQEFIPRGDIVAALKAAWKLCNV